MHSETFNIPTNSSEQELTEDQLGKQDLIDAVAGELHDQWRADRLQDDGSYEPREKTTSDEAWIAEYGTDTVDIANTEYGDLPEDWKGENKEASAFVVNLYADLEGSGVELSLDDPEARSFVGDQIHNAWLSRNDWAKDGALGVSFDELPLDEQEKDLNQFRTLQYVLKG